MKSTDSILISRPRNCTYRLFLLKTNRCFQHFFKPVDHVGKKRKVLLTAFLSHTHISRLSVNQNSNSVTSFSTSPSLLTITICNSCFNAIQIGTNSIVSFPAFFSFKIKGKRGNTRYRYHHDHLTSGISLQEELWQD